MVNKIWGFFIIIGIIVGVFCNKIDIINENILASTKTTIDMILQIFPVIALWLGIMEIAKESGILKKLSNLFRPVLSKLFKEIPENHESLGYISSNVVINMLGLGSAATPFGLKAMKSLSELNNNSKVASKSMITFLILNTSGLTIIPTTVISLRMMHGSVNPTETVLATIISTVISTVLALLVDKIFRKVKG